MTKALAASYRAALLDNGVDLITGDVKIVALDNTYTYNAAHDFLDDIGGGSIVATSGNLASFDSADISIGSPAPGDTITQFWLYRDSGSAATSELIYYFNEDASAAAISLATDGTAKTVVVNASGWFKV
jgi:predicted HAD superfamily phosphohydrolase